APQRPTRLSPPPRRPPDRRTRPPTANGRVPPMARVRAPPVPSAWVGMNPFRKLPVWTEFPLANQNGFIPTQALGTGGARTLAIRSEEHTSELQSPYDLVCR